MEALFTLVESTSNREGKKMEDPVVSAFCRTQASLSFRRPLFPEYEYPKYVQIRIYIRRSAYRPSVPDLSPRFGDSYPWTINSFSNDSLDKTSMSSHVFHSYPCMHIGPRSNLQAQDCRLPKLSITSSRLYQCSNRCTASPALSISMSKMEEKDF